MATSTVVLDPSNMTSKYSLDGASVLLDDTYSCSACGCDFHSLVDPAAEAADAHHRLHQLEGQVKILNSKAASAVDKLADYEDELRYLREAHARAEQQSQTNGASPQPLEGPGPAIAPTAAGQLQQPQQPPQTLSRLASLSALLPGRRKEATSNSAHMPITPATGTFPQHDNNTLSPPKTPFSLIGSARGALQSSHSDTQVVTLSSLQSSLDEERNLRLRAESSLSQTQTELEELTAQLFGQANEMVATERKARAKLEERVRVLEQRDTDKRKRLERLEKAVLRIERVKQMVGP